MVCRCSRFSQAMTVPARYASVWNALCQKASAAYLISDGLEAKISSVQTPQGIYCVCGMPRHTFGQIAGFGEKFLALDHLQDPGNLGTIIRTADAFGADGILLSEGCADCYSPKVLRSTMGSVFRLPIWTVPDLAQTLKELHQAVFLLSALHWMKRRFVWGIFPPAKIGGCGRERRKRNFPPGTGCLSANALYSHEGRDGIAERRGSSLIDFVGNVPVRRTENGILDLAFQWRWGRVAPG